MGGVGEGIAQIIFEYILPFIGASIRWGVIVYRQEEKFSEFMERLKN